jgi:tetratricopeptide (TPR) repeat protein
VGEIHASLQEAGRLIDIFGRDERLVAILEVYDHLGKLGKYRRDLQVRHSLYVAQAYVRLGDTRRADLVLRGTSPVDPLHQALWHALRSEIAKSEGKRGWRETAFSETEKAIELCETALLSDDTDLKKDAQADLPGYQLNRGRLLQYLAYEPQRASEIYKEIIQRWSGITAQRLTVAAAARNLAECLVVMGRGDPASLQTAEFELKRARESLVGYPDEPLNAEILYEKAKLSERRGDDPEISRLLLTECVAESRRAGHGMLECIAGARLYWAGQVDDISGWSAFERVLELYRSHGWALRTLANGRIKAARALERSGNSQLAIDALRRNLADLAAKPGFDRGTDRDRMALMLSGLLALSTDANDRDQCFGEAARHPWMQEWLSGAGLTSIDQAWRGAAYGNR